MRVFPSINPHIRIGAQIPFVGMQASSIRADMPSGAPCMEMLEAQSNGERTDLLGQGFVIRESRPWRGFLLP